MKRIVIKYLKIFVNTLIVILLLSGCFFVLPKAIAFFLPVLIGIGIGALANPVVAFLESKLKIHRKMGSVMIILVVLVGLGLGLYWIISLFIKQFIYFLSDIPSMVKSIESAKFPNNFEKIYGGFPIEVQNSIGNFINQSIREISMTSGRITPYIGGIAKNFVNNIPIVLIYIVFSLLCAYFFVVDKDQIIDKYRKHCPKTFQNSIGFVYDMLSDILGGYFRAQVKLLFLVAIIMMVCFLILRIRYGLVLAFLISFLDALPFLGTGTILIPWAVFRFLNGDYVMGIGLVITYVLTQVVRRILEPKFVADGIGVHPFLAVIFMFIGFKLKGILGMIIAVPLGMIIITVIQNGFVERPIKIAKSVISDIRHFCRIPDIDEEME